jgi:YVTN family beta-propeller protein
MDMRNHILVFILVLGFAAQALAQPIAYIGGRDQNIISVINVPTNQVVSVFESPLPGSLEGSTVSSDNRFIYYTGNGGVIKIDTSNNKIVAQTTLPNNTFAIQVSPDGNTLYTADVLANTVTVLNAADLSVITTVPVDTNPQAITITPDGSKVYTANLNNASVSVIDTATNTLITTINLGASATRGICVHPDGEFVYATNAGSDNVSVIATATDTVVDTISVGDSPNNIAFSPDGAFGYTANGSSQDVSVIRISDNTVVDTISNGGLSFPNGVDVTPDGQFIYVTNVLDDSVSVMRTADNSLVTVLTNKIFDGPVARGRFIVNAPPPGPLPIPTLSQWGLISMAGVLGIIALLAIRRKNATV